MSYLPLSGPFVTACTQESPAVAQKVAWNAIRARQWVSVCPGACTIALSEENEATSPWINTHCLVNNSNDIPYQLDTSIAGLGLARTGFHLAAQTISLNLLNYSVLCIPDWIHSCPRKKNSWHSKIEPDSKSSTKKGSTSRLESVLEGESGAFYHGEMRGQCGSAPLQPCQKSATSSAYTKQMISCFHRVVLLLFFSIRSSKFSCHQDVLTLLLIFYRHLIRCSMQSSFIREKNSTPTLKQQIQSETSKPTAFVMDISIVICSILQGLFTPSNMCFLPSFSCEPHCRSHAHTFPELLIRRLSHSNQTRIRLLN